MSSVVDFAQYLNSAIQAGSAVEGTAVKVIADNGTEIGDAVFKVIQGGNGVASEVGVATQAGTGGAVATGLAYLTMSLPEVALAVAPALGIAAGVGLYNLAPEFWTNLSNMLVETGQTVGGKVLAYWDGLNLNLDSRTIEAVKNAFVQYGVFDNKYDTNLSQWQESVITESTRESVNIPVPAANSLEYTTEDETIISNILYQGNNVYFYNFNNTAVIAISFDRATVTRNSVSYNKSTGETTRGTDTYELGNVSNPSYLKPEGSQAYYRRSFGIYGNLVGISLSSASKVSTATPSDIDAIILYGGRTSTQDLELEDGATYPTIDPFPSTYPDWHIHIYPPELPDITVLPQIYPITYPGIEPYPTQDPAQNPEPESYPVVIPIIIPNLPIPNPSPQPEPGPEPIVPDPDPQPEPEPIEPDPDPEPNPDPADPNIPPTPSVPIVIPPLPDTVDSSKLFTVYNPTSSQLDALGGYLWDSSIIAAIRDIWQEPMDGLISLQQVFVSPVTGGSHNIILGFLDSGVPAAVVSQQFVEVNCGSVTVPENKKNATDYAPYTSLHLYLPFIGIVELDTNECMNSTISVKYKVDVYTGTCLATVSVDREKDMPNDPILYTYSGNCSQQLPLTSGNATGMLGALVGAISTGLSVASGGGLSTLAGAQLLGNSLTHEMMHVSHSGNISANAGIMGQKKPYLIIGRRHCYDANNYNAYYGFPANKTVVLGNHQGFCRVKSAWLKTNALQEEYDQIMELLENGVFI